MMIHKSGGRAVVRGFLIVILVMVGGCGRGSDARQGQDSLDVAIARVEPMLRTSFSSSFAGIEGDDDEETLIVYRKPDPYLDAAVRRESRGVRVVFRDARFSLDDLAPVVRRVEADIPYWRERGIRIRVVVSRVDGSGVNVFVHSSVLAEARDALKQRYGDDRIRVVTPGKIELVD